MIFRSKRHFLSDQKIRFKMPKLPKRWLAVGITFLGLCLGIGISATQVQATSQPVQAVNSKTISPQQSSKAVIATSSLLGSKASVKAISPFASEVGFKDNLHNCYRVGNGCPCGEDGAGCACANQDNNCGCMDASNADCGCGCDGDCDGDCDENDDDDDDDDGIGANGSLKIQLNNDKDIYYGQDYTVEGSVTLNRTAALNGHITYYYCIDREMPIEFAGPQNVGSNPETFKFTIPRGVMVPGNKHRIYVYAVDDETWETSYSKFLKLTAHAEIETIDKTYYVGEEFDQFGNFARGLSVTNQPLTKEEITDTVIRDTDGHKIPKEEWNEITAKSGKYTITYIYKYGSDDEDIPMRRSTTKSVHYPHRRQGGSICKKANISVVDLKKITLNYIDEKFNVIDSKFLRNLPKNMKEGAHFGERGSKFPLVKTPELSFEGKKYYEFVRFEYAVRPAPDLTDDYVIFEDYAQGINVVYKEARATAPIKVELINIMDSKDKVEGSIPPVKYGSSNLDIESGHSVYTIDPTKIEPRPNVDDTIDLENYIEEFESNTPTNKLQLPKGYTIASKPELEKLGLKQENPKFGLEEVKTKFYVVKEKAKKRLTITHKCVNQTTFNRLPDIKQMVEAGETITINTKSSVHRPPLGYKIIGANWDGSNRVDRSLQYNTQTGMISGTIPASPDSPKLTILYRKF